MIFEKEIVSIPITGLSSPVFEKAGLKVNVLRLDQLHPVNGGNKYFKLKLNLEEAKRNGHKRILSFGGPFSNHIAALASAGKQNGFETTGIIRGEKPAELNITLSRALADGMQLEFVSREKYRLYRDEKEWQELYLKFPGSYIIPEGGSNYPGMKGCTEIAKYIPANTDQVILPVGTGATMSGLIAGLKGKSKVKGVSVLNAASYLEKQVNNYLSMLNPDYSESNEDYEFIHDYAFGGYAKKSPELTEFLNSFEKRHGIKTEPIYTGKMFFAVFDLARKGYFEKGTRIMALHTGGLQYLE